MGHSSAGHLPPVEHMARIADEAAKRPPPTPKPRRLADSYLAEFGSYGVSEEHIRAFLQGDES